MLLNVGLAQSSDKKRSISEEKALSIEKIESILKARTDNFKGEKGRWTFDFQEVSMVVITDA